MLHVEFETKLRCQISAHHLPLVEAGSPNDDVSESSAAASRLCQRSIIPIMNASKLGPHAVGRALSPSNLNAINFYRSCYLI